MAFILDFDTSPNAHFADDILTAKDTERVLIQRVV